MNRTRKSIKLAIILAMIAPGTKVYELVEELAKYLPEDIKVKFL